MTKHRVFEDMLDVLNAYASLLDQGGGLFMEDWAQRKALMWDPASGWDMRRLEEYVGSPRFRSRI
jgi:hypothetical protein